MAWIIEDNRKKYKVRCPNCGSIVGFTSVDEMANGREVKRALKEQKKIFNNWN